MFLVLLFPIHSCVTGARGCGVGIYVSVSLCSSSGMGSYFVSGIPAVVSGSYMYL